jgi:uncharacterized protein YjbI with pentapeptide repeats
MSSEPNKDYRLGFSTFAKNRIAEVLTFLRGTWVFLIFFAILLAVLILATSADWGFWAERSYNPQGEITEVKIDHLKIVQQIGLFFAALIGLSLAIWRSLTSHRQAVASLEQSKTAIKQAETASRQAEIAENNQRFDRYARAAQMLDNEKSAVRQAGIYLLRELAIGDEKYRELCAELLASFIRSRVADALSQMNISQAAALKRLAEDTSAVDVVDAFKGICRTGLSKEQIDLTNMVFSNFSLIHPASLVHLDLSSTYLNQIHLHQMVINDCIFSKTVFHHNILHQIRFENNSFFDTIFENVEFEDVCFKSADFWNCTFNECKFRNCDLSGVIFRGDDGELKMPFDAKQLIDCWAWKGDLPRLGSTKFPGTVYDPGSGGKKQIGFAKEWEARRSKGLSYLDIRPDKKLKVGT